MRKALAVLAAVGITATSLVTGLPAEAAPRANASISSTPSRVNVDYKRPYADSRNQAPVKVTYRCTNDAKTTYYLVGTITEEVVSSGGPKGPGVFWEYGTRRSTGVSKARCNGKNVTETLRFADVHGVTYSRSEGVLHLSLTSSGRGPSVSVTRNVKLT